MWTALITTTTSTCVGELNIAACNIAARGPLSHAFFYMQGTRFGLLCFEIFPSSIDRKV
jgi:hypothetical protein